MLGVGGRFASAKGMVRVPNLSNLSRASAQSAIEAAGLVYGGFADTVVADSGLDDKIANQNILPNTLVDYETVISVTRYRYEPPPPPPAPAYPPKPSDDGEIVQGACVSTTTIVREDGFCETNGTYVVPRYRVHTRIDKKKVYIQGPTNWELTLVDQPAVECLQERLAADRVVNASICLGCTTVVEQNFFEGDNTNCASGRGNYRTDIYAIGCTPASRTVQTTCVPVQAPPTPTVTNTTFGDCIQSSGSSTAGIPCASNGGGRRTRTRTFSDGSVVTDNVCCEYVPPAKTCTASTTTGAYGDCNATGLQPGTKSRTVTTVATDCSTTTTTQTATCCIAFCEDFGPWSPSCIGAAHGTKQSRSTTCVSSINCNQYPKTESRCCVSQTIVLGTCIRVGGAVGSYRTRTVTNYNSDCTTTTSTSNVSC